MTIYKDLKSGNAKLTQTGEHQTGMEEVSCSIPTRDNSFH